MQVLKEDVFDSILSSAKELFLTNGYDKTSIEKIAKKAGISKSNLYNYFKSKDDIFCKLTDSAAIGFQKMIEKFCSDQFSPLFGEQGFENMLTDEIYNLIHSHKDGLILLMNYSTGTKYENLKYVLTEQISNKFVRKFSNGSYCNDILFKIVTENLFQGIISLAIQVDTEEQLRLALYNFIRYHSLGFVALISQP